MKRVLNISTGLSGSIPTKSDIEQLGWLSGEGNGNEAIAKLSFEYKILEGANQKYYKGKELIITANGDLRKLIELKVDGAILDTVNYVVKSGSTIVTLKPIFLDNLSEGEHMLTFVYTDGEVSTKFKIVKDVEINAESPKTGDNIIYYIILFIVALVGMVIIILKI